MNIIALDIDDCILSSQQTYFGETDDSLQMLEINLKRIVLMCKKWNMKVFIISAWSTLLEVDKNSNLFSNNLSLMDYEYNGIPSYNLLLKYLNGYVYGVKDTGKEASIRNLLADNHKVVTIEDTDFSHIVHKNHLFCKVYGFLSNRHAYNIHQFMEKNT